MIYATFYNKVEYQKSPEYKNVNLLGVMPKFIRRNKKIGYILYNTSYCKG